MTDHFVSLIRTYVPLWVGIGIAWLIEEFGLVDVDAEGAIKAVTGLCVAIYYAVARWAETRWPAAGVLLGRRATPTYKA